MEHKRLNAFDGFGLAAPVVRALTEKNDAASAIQAHTIPAAAGGRVDRKRPRRGAPARPYDFAHSRGRHDPNDFTSLPFLQPVVRPKPRTEPAAASITGE
jgi:hypothetical protein